MRFGYDAVLETTIREKNPFEVRPLFDTRSVIPVLALGLVSIAGGAALAQDAKWRPLAERFAEAPLRWGGDAEGGAPYVLRDPDDPERIIGFEVELAEALAEEFSRLFGAPVKAEFVQYDWPSLPLGLQRGDFDIILNGYEITPENAQAVLFARPYYVYAQQLVVRAEDNRIRELADCRGKTVATLSGTAAERILEELPANIVPFDGQVEPYLDLANGRVDAVLLDFPIAMYYAGTNEKLKLIGPPIEPGQYGIALRREDKLLKEAIDQALGQLMVSGRMQQIYRKWRLLTPEQAALAKPPNREAELIGLGFDPSVDVVDLDITGKTADKLTFDQYAPLLLRAAGMTVVLTVSSMAVAMVLGLLVCVCRLYGPFPVRALALAYVEFFRGIPLLLLLFTLYFGLASWGVQLPAVYTAIIGFGLNYAAYEAEIYRSSIQAVPVGQWEAGRALGMPEGLTFRRIIFPQAFRTALGPMTNDFVALFKDTSLVSVIAVRELTKEYLILSRSSQKFLELGLLTAVLYLLMSVPLGYLSRYLEKRWGPKH
jgi:polar amino acid transport system substrate-binding protein